MRVRVLAAVAALACATTGVLAGGGAASGAGETVVDLYSSIPLQGASKVETGAVVGGIRLALADVGSRAGAVTIDFTSLDDSTAARGRWDPAATRRNARLVAADPKAIGYIGDFNSGASAISIPILNRAGIPQVSPANTYPGLTVGGPGTVKGEPSKYYPTGKRTFLRLTPVDRVQAQALLKLMRSDGCKRVALTNDKGVYGLGVARLLVLQAAKGGVRIVNPGTGSGQLAGTTAARRRALAAGFRAKGADCFVFAGQTSKAAVALYTAVGRALPKARLYGPDGVCESGFTNPEQDGVPASVGRRYQCTAPTLDLSSYPGGRAFLADYRKTFGIKWPDPYAIYGYEAGRLFVDTLTRLGAQATDRSAVLAALFATKDRRSVLGTYSFDADGDTSLTSYGVYRVSKDGLPVFEKAEK